MADKPFPDIEHCKALAQEHDQQAVLILGVAHDGTVTVSTYGQNKRKCEAIGTWGQGLWANAISIIPFRTAFGWGNGGIPQPLTADEAKALGPAARDYARQCGEPV